MLRRWTDYRREQLQGLSRKNLKPYERLSIVKHVKIIITYDLSCKAVLLETLVTKVMALYPVSKSMRRRKFTGSHDFWPPLGFATLEFKHLVA